MEEKEWIIGYQRESGKVLKYYTVEEAAMRCDIYKIILSASIIEAKELFMSQYIDNDNGE